MFGVMNAVEHKLASVIAVEAIVDRVSVAARLYEAGQAKFGEVLGD